MREDPDDVPNYEGLIIRGHTMERENGPHTSGGMEATEIDDKPTTRLEDTPVVDDDGTVDMEGLSKSGHAYPSGDPEPIYDSDEVFLGFLAGALLSSAAWGAVWVAAITV